MHGAKKQLAHRPQTYLVCGCAAFSDADDFEFCVASDLCHSHITDLCHSDLDNSLGQLLSSPSPLIQPDFKTNRDMPGKKIQPAQTRG